MTHRNDVIRYALCAGYGIVTFASLGAVLGGNWQKASDEAVARAVEHQTKGVGSSSSSSSSSSDPSGSGENAPSTSIQDNYSERTSLLE